MNPYRKISDVTIQPPIPGLTFACLLVTSLYYHYNSNNDIKRGINTTMIALMLPGALQNKLRHNIKQHRLALNLTQEGLAARSGVPLATLRKFEQQGQISFESFVKLLVALQLGESIVEATQVKEKPYSSIDEVIAKAETPKRKRGSRR
jgi:DNA-binding transcriptional regulator YiaG